ncbi:MAG TPA: hypothetical protein VN577_00560 [Terriglobales bacterium]|nr:hypothetical protein [Terriglobales bacterium]
MKPVTTLFMITLAVGTLSAQTPGQHPAVSVAKTAAAGAQAPAAAKPAAKTAQPAAKPAQPVTSTKPEAQKVNSPFGGKKTTPKAATPVPTATPAKAAEKPAEKPGEVKPAVAKQEEMSRVAARPNRRDPFVSPIVRASGMGPACETGKRCLMVDQIQLKGIVKSPNGFIAVVENAAKRAYFLRENDPVFNGTVVKITGDTVVFREMTTDKLGKQGVREVVKKVNAPVV